MPTIDAPITACLKCSGPLFDNRGNLKTPKSPHFRCRDRDCGEAYWLKAKPVTKAVATTATTAEGTESRKINWAQVQRDYYAAAYCAAHGLAKAVGCKLTDLDQSAVQAGAATLLIQLERQGHRIGTLAPKPVVPKPPTAEELSEVPEALQQDEEVPF